MKRATVGSLVFMGGTLFLFTAPMETSALAGPALTRDEAPPILRTAAKTLPVAAVNAAIAQPAAAANSGTRGSCPEGMVEVEGDYCPNVEQPCVKWIDPEDVFPRRCAEFAPTTACQGKTVKKRFCIDRYEWPNRAGEKPAVMKTWYEARDACGAIGKRLCGDSEWTVACEGQDRLPYPYGYQRSADACNIDKPHPDVNEKALGSGDAKVRDAEVARLWQGEPSGARDACVSPYGVFDMTGNVDEWVVNESGKPYNSGLKGGYWGPVRDRCRPMTTIHNEGFRFYQIGFRCCSDAAETPSGLAPARGTAAPLRRGLPSTNPGPLTGS